MKAKVKSIYKDNFHTPGLKVGTVVNVISFDKALNAFEARDKYGDYMLCLVKRCNHLGGGDWELIEEDDDNTN